MRRTPVLLCCVIAVTLAFECHSQTEDSIPLYHWVTQNEVLLWQSQNDPEPLRAVIDVDTGKWTVEPTERKASWRAILARVALNYERIENSNDISDDKLWAFALTKLRNEYTQVRWARQRRASVEIYLLPIDKTHVTVAFIYGTPGGPSHATANFVQNNGVWTKGKEELDLKKLLGVPDDPAQLTELFALRRIDGDARPTDGWQKVWDRWIKDFQTAQSVRDIGYRDELGQTRWLWQERLEAGSTLPDSFRRMPPAPPKIRETSLASAPVLPDTTKSFWSIGKLVGGLVFVIIVFVVVRFRYELLDPLFLLWTKVKERRRLRKASRKAVKNSIDFHPSEAVVTEETLNALHRIAVDRLRDLLGNSTAFGPISSVLEWARQEYVSAASSHQLLHDAATYRNKIIEDYREKELDLAESDPHRIKRWIELGRTAEKVKTELGDLSLPAEVKARLAAQKAPQDDEWVAQWPDLLRAFEVCLSETDSKRDELDQKLKAQEELRRQAVTKKEEETNSKWLNRVSELENEKERCRKQHDQDALTLQTANLKIEEIQKESTTLRADLTAARSDNDTAQVTHSALKKKIDDLNDLKWLSRELRRWLQGYYAGRMNDARESRGVAVLAALINFSLSQMCFSILDDQPNLKKVLAHNILLLTHTFEQHYGEVSDFAQTLTYLNQIAPDVDKGVKKLDETELGGDTLDDPLYRGFLYWLKTDTGKNISPFFVDLDRKKNTLVFVTTT